jgi:glycine dehydrogenase subunit 1
MSFVPHTEGERAEMLAAIGLERIEDLFAAVPGAARFPVLDLPPAISQMQVAAEMRALAARNIDVDRCVSFLGAGVYNHYSPPTVDYVLARGEFYTSYTPYQPEMSQGMLQAMFEYQTMISRLTGMEVSNASHYDGATSLAEAVLTALAVGAPRRNKIVLSLAVHPQSREVVRTYLGGMNATIVGESQHEIGAEQLGTLVDAETAALVVQWPDFFGRLDDLRGLGAACRKAGALFVVAVDPIALGLFEPPGSYGADIVVADGQCLGLPPSFGGPSLGIFATSKDLVRRLVGRLVGQTVDAHGRRGYVLTLGTREQHIRRAKATSNICTNAALGALAASVYLATLGRRGLKRVAELCYHKSHYAAAQIAKLPRVKVNPSTEDKAFFKEFVVSLPRPVREVNEVLLSEHNIIGGYALEHDYPRLKNHMLIAVTETAAKADIDRLVNALRVATA